MGNQDHFRFNAKEAGLLDSPQVVVVAAQQHFETLDWDRCQNAITGLVLAPAADDEAIPDHMVSDAELLVLAVDPENPRSKQRLIDLSHRFPHVSVVAAIPNASLGLVRTLIREGVADVVTLPFVMEELLDTATSILASRAKETAKAIKLAPLIAVVRSSGGCGATTVATHLAAAMQETQANGRGVALLDLDLQYGSVAEYLGCAGRGSIADLLEAQERLDEDLVRSVARTATGDFAVFAAPDGIPPIESVDVDRLLHMLTQLRQIYGLVILDLPANWTNWTLSAVSAADEIVMVVELSLSSLRQAKRGLELFESVGLPKSAISIVVNRVERRLFKTIDLRDVSETLHHPVLASIALEEPHLRSAQDQGMLAHQLNRKSRFAADVGQVAGLLRDRLADGGNG